MTDVWTSFETSGNTAQREVLAAFAGSPYKAEPRQQRLGGKPMVAVEHPEAELGQVERIARQADPGVQRR